MDNDTMISTVNYKIIPKNTRSVFRIKITMKRVFLEKRVFFALQKGDGNEKKPNTPRRDHFLQNDGKIIKIGPLYLSCFGFKVLGTLIAYQLIKIDKDVPDS